jgi:tetratricopeptide (TPR) repeat protein
MKKKLLCAVPWLVVAACAHAQAPTPPPAAPPAAPAAAPAAPISADSPDLQTAVNKAYEDGFADMQSGKFKEALEKVAFIKSKMTTIPPDVVFLEAACAFNLSDFATASAAFDKYIKEFSPKMEENPGIKDSMPRAKLGLGRSLMALGKAEEGIAVLKEVASDPLLKGEAGLFVAEHYRKADKPDDAIQILESIVADGVRSAEQIQAALMCAELYVAKGDTEKAGALLEKTKGGATSGESAAQMNNISLRLGDKMMDDKRYREALGAYQSVRKQSEVIRLMKERERRLLDAQLRQPAMREQIQAKLDADKAMMDELGKRDDYDATLFYRLGRCYFEMQRPWEAILAFEALTTQFKDYPQRDKALYGMIMANATLKRIKAARDLAEKFITDFPDSSEVGNITELYVMLSYQSGNLDEAVTAADKALGFPKADKERLMYLKGNILFEKQAFQDAVTQLEILMQEFPKNPYADDSRYRIALCYFYQNDSKGVRKALTNYISDYPRGQYVIDAKYRLAFIRFQSGETEDAMRDLIALIEEGPNDPNIGQVYTLLGDGFAKKAQSEPEKGDEHYAKAIEAYENGYRKAQGMDVKKYARDALTDLYQSNEKYKELVEMYTSELEAAKKANDPDSILKAIFHITNGLRRDNKIEEAKKLIAENVRPFINNPAMDQVEVLIQQLCQFAAPKKRRIVTADDAKRIREEADKRAVEAAEALKKAIEQAKADGKPEPVADPAAAASTGGGVITEAELQKQYEEIDKQLQELLTPTELTPAGNVRILFARGFMAKVMRLPAAAEKVWGVMVEVASANDCSPYLLSIVGDAARKKKDFDKASACYTRLKDLFSTSEFADGSVVGLGEIAFEKEELDKALVYFTEATSEKWQGSSRLLDAELGKAKTLVKLKKLDDAAKVYDSIARVKEWKIAHPEALFGLGQIEEAKGRIAEGLSFYIRMYVAHQKQKDWLAKAYLQAARCLIRLNKRDEAKKTLQEMLKREDIKTQPEFPLAQSELNKLG